MPNEFPMGYAFITPKFKRDVWMRIEYLTVRTLKYDGRNKIYLFIWCEIYIIKGQEIKS